MSKRKTVLFNIIIRLLSVPVFYILFIVIVVQSKWCARNMKRDKWCSEDQRWWDDCFAQPANTLTNFAAMCPIWVVLLMKRETCRVSLLWGISGVYLALASTLYHGTNGKSISGHLDVASIPVFVALSFRVLLEYRFQWQGYIELLFWVIATVISHTIEFTVNDKNWDVLLYLLLVVIFLFCGTFFVVIIDQRKELWKLYIALCIVSIAFAVSIYAINLSNCDWHHTGHALRSHIIPALGTVEAYILTRKPTPSQQ